MIALVQNVGRTFRQLRRVPGFALTAIVTLALGIAGDNRCLQHRRRRTSAAASVSALQPTRGTRKPRDMPGGLRA